MTGGRLFWTIIGIVFFFLGILGLATGEVKLRYVVVTGTEAVFTGVLMVGGGIFMINRGLRRAIVSRGMHISLLALLVVFAGGITMGYRLIKHASVAETGDPVEFALPSLNGEEVKVSDFLGRVVLIDFFNPNPSKCPNARQAFKTEIALIETFRGSDVVFISVCIEDNYFGSEKLPRQRKDAIVLQDWYGKTYREYFNPREGNDYWFPAYLIVDKQGILSFTTQESGPQNLEFYERHIRRLLGS